MATLTRTSGDPPAFTFGLSCLGLAGFFLAWHLLSVAGVFPPNYLPGPLTVLQTIAQYSSEPYSGATLWTHLAPASTASPAASCWPRR